MSLRSLILLGLLCGILYFCSTIGKFLIVAHLDQIDWIREVVISLVGRPLGIILCGWLVLRIWKNGPLNQFLLILGVIIGLSLIGPILGMLILKILKSSL